MSASVKPVTAEDRMAELLRLIAQSTRECLACGARIYFVRHSNGKLAPYTVDGVNHFKNCPQAGRFSKSTNAAST